MYRTKSAGLSRFGETDPSLKDPSKVPLSLALTVSPYDDHLYWNRN